MRLSARRLLVAAAALAAPSCAPEAPTADVCESAARHIEACTGEYLTPPICDDAAAAQAEQLLALDCDGLAAGAAQGGKADGALCNWFGAGCVPDEVLFTGPSCSSSSSCAAGSLCLEGHCFAGLGTPEAERMLDQVTGTRVTDGSSVTPLITGGEAHALWLDLIAEATHSVHVTTLVIEDDPTAGAVVDALRAAARRGVEVRVIVDGLSQHGVDKYAVVASLAAAGVQVTIYNPSLGWATLRPFIDLNVNQRIHEKILVVDGVVAITGGRNIGAHYMADGNWRDRDLLITGPAVADLQRVYLGNWDEFSAWERRAGCRMEDEGAWCRPAGAPDLRDDARYYPSLPAVGDARVRVIYSNPRKDRVSDGYVTYLALVRSARHTIQITNQYFVPPQRLRRHLRAAAARGVRIEVVTNSKTSHTQPYMWYAAINHYEEMIKGGVTICEWNGGSKVHAKAMVVDGHIGLIGSWNIDPRSAASNSEEVVLVEEPGAVAELVAALDYDRAHCDVADYDFSLADRAKAAVHRLAEPLL